MGVTNLWNILSPVAQHKSLRELAGQTLAVDLSMWVCETKGVKQMQGIVVKPHLRNLFFRCSCLLQLNVNLVFVIEGEAPQLKWEEMQKRQQSRFGGKASAKSKADVKPRKQGRSHFNSMLRECCELLDVLGVPYIQSQGEAEATCAFLNYSGLVDACLTDDGDAFLYGATKVYRNFTMFNKDPHVESYSAEDIQSRLGLDRSKLIGLALLLGCDYLPKGVPGVGEALAMKYMMSVRNVNVLQRFEEWLIEGDEQLSGSKKPPHCTTCGHPGVLRVHRQTGCEWCCTDEACHPLDYDEPCPCPWHQEQKSLQHRIHEVTIKKKALSTPGFPNKQVIKEFLIVKDKLPKWQFYWKRPQLAKAQVFNLAKLEWPTEYSLEKILPLVTLWDQLDIKKTEMTSSQHLIPMRIVKTRVRQGVSCFEVEWQKVSDVESEYPCYITIEEQSLFRTCFPSVVTTFEEETQAKKNKSKKKKGKKAVEDTASQDEITSLSSRIESVTLECGSRSDRSTSQSLEIETIQTKCSQNEKAPVDDARNGLILKGRGHKGSKVKKQVNDVPKVMVKQYTKAAASEHEKNFGCLEQLLDSDEDDNLMTEESPSTFKDNKIKMFEKADSRDDLSVTSDDLENIDMLPLSQRLQLKALKSVTRDEALRKADPRHVLIKKRTNCGENVCRSVSDTANMISGQSPDTYAKESSYAPKEKHLSSGCVSEISVTRKTQKQNRSHADNQDRGNLCNHGEISVKSSSTGQAKFGMKEKQFSSIQNTIKNTFCHSDVAGDSSVGVNDRGKENNDGNKMEGKLLVKNRTGALPKTRKSSVKLAAEETLRLPASADSLLTQVQDVKTCSQKALTLKKIPKSKVMTCSQGILKTGKSPVSEVMAYSQPVKLVENSPVNTSKYAETRIHETNCKSSKSENVGLSHSTLSHYTIGTPHMSKHTLSPNVFTPILSEGRCSSELNCKNSTPVPGLLSTPVQVEPSPAWSKQLTPLAHNDFGHFTINFSMYSNNSLTANNSEMSLFSDVSMEGQTPQAPSHDIHKRCSKSFSASAASPSCCAVAGSSYSHQPVCPQPPHPTDALNSEHGEYEKSYQKTLQNFGKMSLDSNISGTVESSDPVTCTGKVKEAEMNINGSNGDKVSSLTDGDNCVILDEDEITCNDGLLTPSLQSQSVNTCNSAVCSEPDIQRERTSRICNLSGSNVGNKGNLEGRNQSTGRSTYNDSTNGTKANSQGKKCVKSKTTRASAKCCPSIDHDISTRDDVIESDTATNAIDKNSVIVTKAGDNKSDTPIQVYNRNTDKATCKPSTSSTEGGIPENIDQNEARADDENSYIAGKNGTAASSHTEPNGSYIKGSSRRDAEENTPSGDVKSLETFHNKHHLVSVAATASPMSLLERLHRKLRGSDTSNALTAMTGRRSTVKELVTDDGTINNRLGVTASALTDITNCSSSVDS